MLSARAYPAAGLAIESQFPDDELFERVVVAVCVVPMSLEWGFKKVGNCVMACSAPRANLNPHYHVDVLLSSASVGSVTILNTLKLCLRAKIPSGNAVTTFKIGASGKPPSF